MLRMFRCLIRPVLLGVLPVLTFACVHACVLQAALAARTDKCREKSEKIKEGLEQKNQAFSDLSNKTAESINERMVYPFSVVHACHDPLFHSVGAACPHGLSCGC